MKMLSFALWRLIPAALLCATMTVPAFGGLRTVFKTQASVVDALIGPDSKTLIAATWDQKATISFSVLDLAANEQRLFFKGFAYDLQDLVPGVFWAPIFKECMALSPDGKTFCAAAWTGRLMLWDVRTGKQLQSNCRGVPLFSFSPTGDRWLFRSGTHVRLREFPTGKIHRDVDVGNYLWGAIDARLAPDGKTIAALNFYGPLTLWDVETGKQLWCSYDTFDRKTLGTETQGHGRLVFSPEGKTLALADPSRIILWNPKTGKMLRMIKISGESFACRLAFSADGKTIVTGSYNNENLAKQGFNLYTDTKHHIRFWDVASGKETRRLFKKREGLLFLGVSPDRKRMILGAKSKVLLWDMPKWWCKRPKK